MGTININNTGLGNSLTEILMAEDLMPGDEPSYQVCKSIYLSHPLGGKMIDTPVKMAMAKPRDITVPGSPEDVVVRCFKEEWKSLKADDHIRNAARIARIYGIGTLVYGTVGTPTDRPINPFDLADKKIYFTAFDPLNTAGSLVLNQMPNDPDFLKVTGVSVQGDAYHRSRVCVIMNEEPIYLGYTNSAFGYVGRSVYQRALYPLKSFVQTMVTDDMISRKAGLLIASMKMVGSFVDSIMQALSGVKRAMLQQGGTNNVLAIEEGEKIESLNLQNIDGAGKFARDNILKNIATAADMPAHLLTNETLVEGFGEGTEDAKRIADYIEGIQTWLQPLYDFMDTVVRYRAWNAEFYKTVQAQFPETYGKVPYRKAFMDWTNAFVATHQPLITEPESEEIKVEQTKMEAVIAVCEVLLPMLDPENRTILVKWVADCFNENKMLFPSPLELDYDGLAQYAEKKEQQAQDAAATLTGEPGGEKEQAGSGDPPKVPKPFHADSASAKRLVQRLERMVKEAAE